MTGKRGTPRAIAAADRRHRDPHQATVVRTHHPLRGDEFVRGLGGTDVAKAERRFDSIGAAIEAGANVGISVALASLAAGDTADQLTQREDAAMMQIKVRHHAGG